MNAELEKLIELVVADGQVTEKERSFVIKKAIELGIDTDEAEIYLDGRLHQVNQTNKQVVFPAPPLENKSNKEGELKKCPSCGSIVQSFNTKCSECGHEYRNTSAVSSISVLSSRLEAILNENMLGSDTESKELGVFARMDKVNDIAHKQAQTIVNFPIPNTKEDILEFLSFALPKAKPRSFWANNINGEDTIQPAWRTKCEEIILKARFAMKEDKKTLEEIERYAKELKIK